jgi:hypothetical protein
VAGSKHKERAQTSLDYRNSTVEEILKWYEAVAFRFPAAMTQAFDSFADFSVREMEQWWRMLYAPTGQFMSAIWPQLAGAAEVETLAAELDQLRAQLRADTAERDTSNAAAAARFDHLRDEISGLREALSAAAAAHEAAVGALGAQRDRLRAELETLREELRGALADKEASAATGAAALKSLQAELRALRDRIDSALDAKSAAGAGASATPATSRAANDEPSRRRPRR